MYFRSSNLLLPRSSGTQPLFNSNLISCLVVDQWTVRPKVHATVYSLHTIRLAGNAGRLITAPGVLFPLGLASHRLTKRDLRAQRRVREILGSISEAALSRLTPSIYDMSFQLQYQQASLASSYDLAAVMVIHASSIHALRSVDVGSSRSKKS